MPIASSIEPRTTVQERFDSDDYLGDAQAENMDAYREARNAIPEGLESVDDLKVLDLRVALAVAKAFIRYDLTLEESMGDGE